MTSPVFTPAEIEYLRAPGRIARLATIGPDGGPQVRPVGYLLDPATGTFDVPGLDNPATQKWRNVRRDERVSLVVDDSGDGDGWSPRALEVRGVAEVLPDTLPDTTFPGVRPGVIRIHPRRVLSFGVDADGPGNRTVAG